MQPARLSPVLCLIVVIVCLFQETTLAQLEGNPAFDTAASLAEVRERWLDPPAAFRPAPLFVWNGDMQEEEISRQLDEFAAQGFGGVFIHPRPGLVTPYLSERWLELWRHTLDEAGKRGMVTYIYDENSYPSGFAGGHVPEAMPESRQVILRHDLFLPDELEKLTVDADTVGLYRFTGRDPNGRIRVTVHFSSGTIEAWNMGGIQFRFEGKFSKGSVAFRAIKGRDCIIDDVLLYQRLEDGSEDVILEDDFERDELGDGWVKESLTPGADGSALSARIENGTLVLDHDGTMNDTWLRPARSIFFEGAATVFEFTVVARSGDLGGNPALAVGAAEFIPGKTDDVMLIDFHGDRPELGHGMVNGRWVQGRASESSNMMRHRAWFERIALPDISGSDTMTAEELGLDPGVYMRYRTDRGGRSAWLGGRFYVDLMRPGVTQKFLDITLGAYDRVIGDDYGKTVLACFTDEPHVTGGWTPAFPEVFEELHGYSILDCLPSVHMNIGSRWLKVRRDYTATILHLFTENFSKPYSEACAERGIAFTGHVWEHGWPGVGHCPDSMSFYAWQQIPGIDCLMNQYSEGPNAQFGNWRAAAEVRSIASQLGKKRVLCEAYGAAGWDATLQDFKRIGDWLLVGGVNLLNPHLSYYTIRGARKADHPPSFSYHEPWWEAYHISADYFGRLSWALAAGRERNEILVIEPTTTMWYKNWSRDLAGELKLGGSRFQELITELAAAQVAFDLGSETVMASHARVDGDRLVVGECSYSTVILPHGLETVEQTTERLLEEFARAGGRIVSCHGLIPGIVETGCISENLENVFRAIGDRWVEWNRPFDPDVLAWIEPEVSVDVEPPQDGRVYHLLRELDDGRLLFLVNTSLTEEAGCMVTAAGGRVEQWDPADGAIAPVACSKAGEAGPQSVSWNFSLPPAGSALFALHGEGMTESLGTETKEPLERKLAARGPLEIGMLDPNVLPIDFMDLEVEGERHGGLYRYEAQTRLFQANGFDRNCWDRAVQFEDELLRRERLAEDSAFSVFYHFRLQGFERMPALKIVVENGVLYEVLVNGKRVDPSPGEWWLDRSFTIYRIDPQWLENGLNTVETRADAFSIHHEIEPVYVLGDFCLESADRGWTLVPTQELELGPWSGQGRPCYSGRVAYTRTFDLDPNAGKHVVELGTWSGTVARVDVNGREAGYIGWQPWSLDISDHIQQGENIVTVVVYGSLKNLLGPHHRGKVRGSAWPGHYLHSMQGGQPAGDGYDVIPYGLSEPFDVLSR